MSSRVRRSYYPIQALVSLGFEGFGKQGDAIFDELDTKHAPTATDRLLACTSCVIPCLMISVHAEAKGYFAAGAASLA